MMLGSGEFYMGSEGEKAKGVGQSVMRNEGEMELDQ
jgi:hypothetical protein